MEKESVTIPINDKNFAEEVLHSELPVLVEFWATWCGPCRRLHPIVEELAKEYSGKVKITKLNVEENPLTSSQYGVRGIPMLILFKNGTLVDQMVGLVPKTKLKTLIEKAFQD